MPVPVGVPQTFDEHIKLQFDLLSLAFQADITRVGTLLFARDLTGRTYPESEAPTSGFHGVSHHGEDPRRIAELSKINQYHVKMVAYLAESLAKKQDGAGSLLDQSLILYGSNMVSAGSTPKRNANPERKATPTGPGVFVRWKKRHSGGTASTGMMIGAATSATASGLVRGTGITMRTPAVS